MLIIERTFGLIKPDAVRNKHTGNIITCIENSGLVITNLYKKEMSEESACRLYQPLNDRPFFPDLISYITSGPLIIIVLEGNNAVARWRELMGATNPKDAAPGTIRHLFGVSLSENAVHGSDSVESAQRELSIFYL